MSQFPTRADFFNIGADEVFSRSAARPATSRLTPEEVFTEGSDINIVIAAAAAMADEVTRRQAHAYAGLLLDSARGQNLDRLVNDRWSPTVVRKQATAAIVTLSYTRTGDTTNAVIEAAGKKVRTQRGTEFELLQSISIPAGSTGPQTGLAQATQTGTTGNVAASTITQFVDAPGEPTVSVTNPAPASGGDDVETDARLRERGRQFYVTARRGTLPAVEFGALTVGGVRSATTVEVLDDSGLPNGIIELFIADSNGQSNNALAQSVRSALREFRAGGIVVDVIPSQPEFVIIEYSLLFKGSGVNTTAAAAQLQTLTINAVNNLGPGNTLEVSLLTSLARTIPGLTVDDNTVVQPAGDLEPDTAPGNVRKTFRTSADKVLTTARSTV